MYTLYLSNILNFSQFAFFLSIVSLYNVKLLPVVFFLNLLFIVEITLWTYHSFPSIMTVVNCGQCPIVACCALDDLMLLIVSSPLFLFTALYRVQGSFCA